MKALIKNILLIILCLVLILFLLKKGFENKVDPLWNDVVRIVNTDTDLLSEREDSLQRIFDSIHPESTKNARDLISKPFLPITSWKRFSEILQKVLTEKKVVIIGSSGTGKTTIIDRVSLIVTCDAKNIYHITCVEGLDQDYNKKWIGTQTRDGFKPGKLLQLFEECKKNQNQNYMLIVDDFDKIYRSTFFGAAIWNELDNPDYKNTIEGYAEEITIPQNLYIISTINPSNSSKLPFTSSDYRRLTNGNPYRLEPNLIELKEYLIADKKRPLTVTQKDSLIRQLYFFAKTNALIKEKISESAMIGQWSDIQKNIKNFDFNSLKNVVSSHTYKFENYGKLTKNDFDSIEYTLNHKGKVPNSNNIVSFLKKLIELGLLSELTVAILVAIVSFLSFKRTRLIRKKNIDSLLEDIEFIEKKFLNNVIHYNNAYGNLLSIKDDIQAMSKKGSLNFSQANYLTHKLKESLKIMDFVNNLEQNNDELSNFMKEVIVDDDITKEEYDNHIQYLRDNREKIDSETYHIVKQQLIRLYHKSKVKHNRL